MRRIDSITDSTDLSKLRENVEDRGAWCAVVHGVTWGHKESDTTYWLSNNMCVCVCSSVLFNTEFLFYSSGPQASG